MQPRMQAVIEQLETYGPEHCEPTTYEQAAAYTRELTATHYENFTVVSWLLPRELRDDFRHVYAFCRWADDLGDETGDPQRSLELLDWWRQELTLCYEGKPRHPVYVALARTVEKHDIPRKPFDDLIDAFVQDQQVTRYETWEQTVDYCTRSADPVGRLVLYMCGYRDEERQRLSDATCTALQLANFWQDVRRDIVERDRVYIPREIAREHGLDIEQMVAVVKAEGEGAADCTTCASGDMMTKLGSRALLEQFKPTCQALVDRTWPLFEKGRELWPLLDKRYRTDIKLFTLGGESILKMIERVDYATLLHRPSLSKGQKLGLMMRALLGKVFG